MKKHLIAFIVLFVLLNTSLAFAGKLGPLEIDNLEVQSKFIIIGKVERITLLEGDMDGAKNYNIDSVGRCAAADQNRAAIKQRFNIYSPI